MEGSKQNEIKDDKNVTDYNLFCTQQIPEM